MENKKPNVMFFSVTYEKSETARPVLECTGFNRIPLVNETMVKDTVAHINSKDLGQKLSAIPNSRKQLFRTTRNCHKYICFRI